MDILYVPPRGIGDMIFSLPLLHSLKKAYSCNIFVPIMPDKLELLKLVGLKRTARFLSSEDVLEKKRVQAIKNMDLKKRHSLENKIFCKYLCGQNYDLAVVTTEVGANFDIKGVCKRQISENDLQPYDEDHCLIADRFLRFADYLGIERVKCFDLNIGLKNIGMFDEPYLIFYVGGSKSWALKGYAETASECISNGLNVILVGAPSSYEMARDLKQNESRIVNTVKKNGYWFDLESFAILASKSKAVIGPDTGLVHLADAVGAKVICLFGKTSHNRFYPYNNKKNVISRYDKDGLMENIKSSEVIEKLLV